jgi:hypothetical protein
MTKLLPILLSLAVLLSSTGMVRSANDLKMIPLTEILSEETSFANTSTYLLRCISLIKLNSLWLQSQKKAKARDMAAQLSKAVEEMIEYWRIMEKIQSLDEKPNKIFFLTQIKLMSVEYGNMMSKSKALTGSVFADPVVRSDFIICKDYNKIIMKTLSGVKNKRLYQ